MKSIILLFTLLISVAALGALESIDSVIAKMEASDSKITTLKFNIKQEIYYNITNEKQLSEGEVVFQKPGKMHYRQTEPIEQIIVTNSKKVWIYVKPYNQVISDSWQRWTKSSFIPKSLVNFSNNWQTLKKSGEFSILKEDSDHYVILLVPSKENDWRMEFWINKSTYLPVKTILSSDNIRITTQIFTYVINPKVESSVFEFKSPQGAEVINN